MDSKKNQQRNLNGALKFLFDVKEDSKEQSNKNNVDTQKTSRNMSVHIQPHR